MTSTLSYITRRTSADRPFRAYSNTSLHHKLACRSIGADARSLIEAELVLRERTTRKRVNAT